MVLSNEAYEIFGKFEDIRSAINPVLIAKTVDVSKFISFLIYKAYCL